jgi:hypothetical protein
VSAPPAARCRPRPNRRPFVYTYRLLISPDIDMVYQAVFGAHGERLLLRMGLYQGENIRTVETCATLTVQADGQVAKQAATCARDSWTSYRA